MSRISRIAIENITFNGDRRWDRAIYDTAGGGHLMINMENGTGKSVFQQLNQNLYLYGREWDQKDRNFTDYLKEGEPAVVMHEYLLDGDFGRYVLVGYIAKKERKQADLVEGDSGQAGWKAKVITFITSYDNPECEWSIDNLEIVKEENGYCNPMTFSEAESYLKNTVKAMGSDIRCYNVSDSDSRRKYNERLRNYGISTVMWKDILYPLNKTESGLATFFEDNGRPKSKDDILNDWFLKTIEAKQNRTDNSREKGPLEAIKETMRQTLRTHRENLDYHKQEAEMDRFLSYAENELQPEGERYDSACEEEKSARRETAEFLRAMNVIKSEKIEEKGLFEEKRDQLGRESEDLQYEQLSSNFYRHESLLAIKKKDTEAEKIQVAKLRQKYNAIKEQEQSLRTVRCYQSWKQSEKKYQKSSAEYEAERMKDKQTKEQLALLGGKAVAYYQEVIRLSEEDQKKQSQEQKKTRDNITAIEKERSEKLQRKGSLEYGIRQKQTSRKEFLVEELPKFETATGIHLEFSIVGEIAGKSIDDYKRETSERRDLEQKDLDYAVANLEKVEADVSILDEKIHTNDTDRELTKASLKKAEEELYDIHSLLEWRKNTADKVNYTEDIRDTEGFCNFIEGKKKLAQKRLSESNQRKTEKQEKKDHLQNILDGSSDIVPRELISELEEDGITVTAGMDFLGNKKMAFSTKEKNLYVNAQPLLPYSILISRNDIEALSSHVPSGNTPYAVPVLIREDLKKVAEKSANLTGMAPHYFYSSFNRELLDESSLREKIVLLEAEIEEEEEIEREQNYYLDVRRDDIYHLKNDHYSIARESKGKSDISRVRKNLESLLKEGEELKAKKTEQTEQMSIAEKNIKNLEEKQKREEDILFALNQLDEKYKKYLINLDDLARNQKELDSVKKRSQELLDTLTHLREEESYQDKALANITRSIKELREEAGKYNEYRPDPAIPKEDEIDRIISEYNQISGKQTDSVLVLEANMKNDMKNMIEKKRAYQDKLSEYAIDEEAFLQRDLQIEVDDIHLAQLQQERKDIDHRWNIQNDRYETARNASEREEYTVDNILNDIKKFGKSNPMPRERVRNEDFKELIRSCEEKIRELSNKIQNCNEIISEVDSQTDNLSRTFPEVKAFMDDIANPNNNLHETLRDENKNQIRAHAGDVQKNYQKAIKDRDRQKKKIGDMLVEASHKFSEEYQKKINNLSVLLNDFSVNQSFVSHLSEIIQAQNEVKKTISSYLQNEKRETEILITDISEYIRTVHKDLISIGGDSKVTILGKQQQMLRIRATGRIQNLNEENIKSTIEEYIRELCQYYIKLDSEKGVTEQRFVNDNITTQKIYDQVYGIRNINLSLCKVEKEKVTRMDWNTNRKASGGEQSLSAFTIISSLLNYLDEPDDMFADFRQKNSRSFIMDNPFGKLSSGHLLDPLFQLADKTNTQLICLSALKDQSILKQFDRIINLSLVKKGELNHIVATDVKGSSQQVFVQQEENFYRVEKGQMTFNFS